jgi:hypothetical protein
VDKIEAVLRWLEAHPTWLMILDNVDDKEAVDAARSLSNLALMLGDTNRPSEAEPLHRRALAIYKESLGPDHP